jgi:RNA polymerase sigma-70 factor (ECF subfamily)
MSDRTNDQWLLNLRDAGRAQEAALADLRGILLAGLPYALSSWLPPGDPRYEPLAEEVVQETLVRVLARLDTFEGRSAFTTWVHTIAVRIALTELRRARWRDRSLDEMVEDAEVEEHAPVDAADPAPGPEVEAERTAVVDQLRRFLMEELTDRQRQALLAAGIHGLPLEEVARRMGTNRNALYKLMHDGRMQLKRRLRREGLSVEDLLAVFEHG